MISVAGTPPTVSHPGRIQEVVVRLFERGQERVDLAPQPDHDTGSHRSDEPAGSLRGRDRDRPPELRRGRRAVGIAARSRRAARPLRRSARGLRHRARGAHRRDPLARTVVGRRPRPSLAPRDHRDRRPNARRRGGPDGDDGRAAGGRRGATSDYLASARPAESPARCGSFPRGRRTRKSDRRCDASEISRSTSPSTPSDRPS